MSETEYTSIRIKKETYNEAKEAKSERETWDEFILRSAEEPVAVMSEERVREIVQDEMGDS